MPVPHLKLAGIALALFAGADPGQQFRAGAAVFISRSGPVFVFARLMQDGIVKRLLDDTCPQSGYHLCPYRDRLPHNANAWLWGADSLFHRDGGFAHSQAEDSRMIVDSLKRYPLMQLKAAVYDSVLQFFMFKTGDGIESQARILRPGIAQGCARPAARLSARPPAAPAHPLSGPQHDPCHGGHAVAAGAGAAAAPCRAAPALGRGHAARAGAAGADRQCHHLRHFLQSP